MKPFDDTNWYWFVDGDETRVYSSVTGDYVPVGDPTVVSWMADGTVPSSGTTENLGKYLANTGNPFLRPNNADVLQAYQVAAVINVAQHHELKILFNHENRIRALESRPPITTAQFRAAVKSLL